ncbi:hypothetical protein BDF19DRAFT_271242 [Syncephalis fuscata]|nr:hypothetical protein BDF19DRAFT_271242 [Syncephalis fuscata]
MPKHPEWAVFKTKAIEYKDFQHRLSQVLKEAEILKSVLLQQEQRGSIERVNKPPAVELPSSAATLHSPPLEVTHNGANTDPNSYTSITLKYQAVPSLAARIITSTHQASQSTAKAEKQTDNRLTPQGLHQLLKKNRIVPSTAIIACIATSSRRFSTIIRH